jgi:hypothetical protein
MKAVTSEQQDPNGLLDEAMRVLNLKNDAALARVFDVAPPVLSKIRHRRLPVGASFMLKCHEIAGMTLPTIRSYVGGVA